MVNGLQKTAIHSCHFFSPDNGQTFDVVEMAEAEFDVLPERACVPASELLHVEQHANLAVVCDHKENNMILPELTVTS